MDNDALLFQLRTIARAYPDDVFPPFSDDELERHKAFITRASGCMGRHLAQFIAQAADEIERLNGVISDGAKERDFELQLLKAAHCPTCDNTGTTPDGDECEWCFYRKRAIADLPEAPK